MNILAIDTSNELLGVAVLNHEKVLGEISTNVKNDHSVRLMPAIVSLLEHLDMKPDHINKVVVAQGPGSYTGVRIGVTTAKSIAWALNIPIVGVSSLEALSYNGSLFNGMISPFFDARRKMVYTGLYEKSGSQMIVVEKETNISMEEWLIKIAKRNEKILFLSPHFTVYREMIEQIVGDLAVIPPFAVHITRAAHVGYAGMYKDPVDVHSVTPNYLRLAEAEAKWLKANKGSSI